MNNAIIIIFGATGDLARRKLIPALYQLLEQGALENVVIVGAALDDIPALEVLERARPFIKKPNDAVWLSLKEKFFYQPLNFSQVADYEKLNVFIEDLEKKYSLRGNRLVYCAAAAYFFSLITRYTGESKIIRRTPLLDKDIWHRIVYEKPFGHDLKSAHEINECIAAWLDESQVYRIDHYLTKELVSNISLIRFMNCVFQPIWDNRYIDQIQIILSEDICIEGRGAYYDYYGALCDVVQNHMLELLALMTMESPEMLIGDYIRTQRARVLEKVQFIDGLYGQYDGYTKENGVAPDSRTETFAALFLRIANPRWAGVPFYLKTGKCLDKAQTTIHVKFKQVDCLLAKNCPSDSNWLTIKIAPEATFSLSLNVKKPGSTTEMTSVAMEFCHSCIFGERTPEAYQVLLGEIMRGDTSVSVRFDEIEYLWRVIDQAKRANIPLYSYKKGSTGPIEMTSFEQKHGFRWRT